MKKIVSVMLAMAMAVSLMAFSASAAGSDDAGQIVWSQDGITIEKIEGDFISPRSVLFEEDYTGVDAYHGKGDCIASEGNCINVYFNNTNGNGDLYPVFTLYGYEIATSKLMVEKGKGYTYRIMRNDNGDIESTLLVDVHSRDGHMMNFFIRARQYVYVP